MVLLAPQVCHSLIPDAFGGECKDPDIANLNNYHTTPKKKFLKDSKFLKILLFLSLDLKIISAIQKRNYVIK